MNILMVLSDHGYPPDRRVEREARDLIRDGHKLFLLARRDRQQSREEIVDGVHVIRVPLPFVGRRIVAGVFYYFFQRYFMLLHILRACRKHRIEALHVHDLPYAFATVVAGKLLGIPVVFDTHEHFTAMLELSYESGLYRRLRALAFLQLIPLRVEERIVCRWASTTIVVADEHVPRIASLGAARENIVVVTNTEDSDYFSGLPIDESLVDEYRGDFVLLYVGTFCPHRGLETVIQAMPAVLEQIPNARFLLVGDGFTRGELEKLVADRSVGERVTFAGYQPFQSLPTYIHLSAVGVIPHISTPLIETTMPNKLFQFMILGKPVIVSSTRPMMRVVSETECGLVFRERDPGSLAQAIVQLRDEGLRRRLGENGKRAVADSYNWQNTVQALLRLYRSDRRAPGNAEQGRV